MPKKKPKRTTTTTTTRRVTVATGNPTFGHRDREDLAAENAMLRRELAELRAAGAHASARHARISRAASRAGMPVDQWVTYAHGRGRNPEVFDREIAEALESDRVLAPYRARRISGAGSGD